MKKILSFGELLWDVLPTQTILGGAPFNFAYRINSLGEQGLIVTRLGGDVLGQEAFDKVVSLGLNTDFIQWDDEKPTGTVKVSFDKNNNPDYIIIQDVAYDQIGLLPSLFRAAEERFR